MNNRKNMRDEWNMRNLKNMRNMKKLINILAICMVALSLTACGGGGTAGGRGNGKNAKAVADDFLTSYFAGEYDKAVTYCTDTLASSITQAVQDQDFETEEVKNTVMKMSKDTKVTIGDVEKGETKNDCKVTYELTLPDSSKLKSQVSMVKSDGVWKVGALE